MQSKRNYFTLLRLCKGCYYNMSNIPKSFKHSKALQCPNCGSSDRKKFKRSR